MANTYCVYRHRRLDTNKIYNTIKSASKDSKLTYTALKAQLSGQNKNKSDFKYLEYESK